MFTFLNAAHLGSARPRLLSVQALEDIEYLVKESEVRTGQSGRTFVIAGADRLIYRVHWRPRNHSPGLSVDRLDAQGCVLSSQQLQLWEFLEHSLIEAQAAGQLFTPAVGLAG